MPSFLLRSTSVAEGGRQADMLEVEGRHGAEAAIRQGQPQDSEEALEKEEKEKLETRQRNMDMIVLCAFVVQELIALYLAFHVGEGIPEMTPEDERDPERYRNWSDKPLDCCAEPRLCCLSCFCPCLVFGMTAQRIGCEPLDQFWKGCLAFWAISVLAALIGLLGMILIGTLVFAVRRRLREQFAFPVQSSHLLDFAFSCCCPILALAQEARHVERSKKAGFTYTPSVQWPAGNRPPRDADQRGGFDRGAGGLLAGPPVVVSNRMNWEGDFRGACGSISSGLVTEQSKPETDSNSARRQLGA